MEHQTNWFPELAETLLPVDLENSFCLLRPLRSSNLGTSQDIYHNSHRNTAQKRVLAEELTQGHHLKTEIKTIFA